MASSRIDRDGRDELAQGLPATGQAPIGGDAPDLPRPLGDRASEKLTGRAATSEPVPDGTRERRMHVVASKLLAVGGVLFVLGVIVSAIADGLPDGIGVALMALAVPPTLAGVGMEVAWLVNRRSRRDKSFA